MKKRPKFATSLMAKPNSLLLFLSDTTLTPPMKEPIDMTQTRTVKQTFIN